MSLRHRPGVLGRSAPNALLNYYFVASRLLPDATGTPMFHCHKRFWNEIHIPEKKVANG